MGTDRLRMGNRVGFVAGAHPIKPLSEDERSLLQKELDEIHQYIRQLFQLQVGWFTFFVTVNYYIMSSEASRTTGHAPPWLPKIALMFISQNALGVLTCSILAGFYLQSNTRVRRLLDLMRGTLKVKSPMPANLLAVICLLMLVTLVTVGAMWVVIYADRNVGF